MRNLLAILLLICVAATRVPQPATRAAKPTIPIAAKDCVTSECHAAVKSFEFVHGPVNVNDCGACHEMTDAKAHKFRSPREKAEMCTYCHEFNVAGLAVVHKPVTNGECLGCHDPHGGKTRSVLREKSVAALCARCHESMTLGLSHVHTPVAKGDCDICHAPHAARYKGLLDAVGSDLCLACHQKIGQQVAIAMFKHKSLERGCEQCHDVHASANDKQIIKPVAELCTGCHEHEKVRTQAEAATHKHTVVMKDKSCITCHAAHSSDVAKLMLDPPLKVCMSCHRDKIDGTNIVAVKEINDPQMTRHGALKDGECGGCHAAHGNDRPAMLTKQLTAGHYQTFSAANYELCFSCHDVRLAIEEKTTERTKFRNGQRNLHWVHVVQQGDRGEGCRVCHEVHAAGGAKNVRTSFVYGKRELPINFIASATGGKCTPECHVPYAYDRDRPVPVTTQPASRPSRPRMADNSPSATQMVKDTPDKRVERVVRVSEILLGSGKSDEALKLVEKTMADLPNSFALQVVHIKALIATDQAIYALELISSMPMSSFAPGQYELLRGMALAAQRRWVEATAALQSAQQKAPKLAEAHYLMGQVYEAQQLWKQAAQEYRIVHELNAPN